jgi:hypothetical protein
MIWNYGWAGKKRMHCIAWRYEMAIGLKELARKDGQWIL